MRIWTRSSISESANCSPNQWGDRNQVSPFSYQEVRLSPDLSTVQLCLYLEEKSIPIFFRLLQQGFGVEVQTGRSVKSFLCDQLGLDPEYVANRIKTLFLDGKPVDDIDSAMIRDGSTLAISGALPGLAGRVLRSGGRFASMRGTISYREKTVSESPKQGVVSMKLFNILLREMGPTFLKNGVWIEGNDLEDLIKRQPDTFWAGCKKASLDGKEVDLKEFSGLKWKDREVFLQLRTD